MSLSPLVSIIIVNYNGKEYLEKCLGSVKNIDYGKFEVILIDNNSSDESINFVKKHHPSVNIIKLEKNYGFAEPNNIGAKTATGEFLLFLNNDTLVTPNFVTELVNVICKNPQIAICQSLLLKTDELVDSSGDFVDVLGRAYSSKERTPKLSRILSAKGASMLIRKKIFYELGGFDKNFFASFEDVDLGWRANIHGYQVVLVPKSIVYHEGGKTIRKMSEEIQFHGVKNSIVLRLVNFEFSYAVKSIVSLFFIYVLRKFFGLKVVSDPEESPPLPSIKILFKGGIWILRNLNYILEKRKILNSKRVTNTASLINNGLITKV